MPTCPSCRTHYPDGSSRCDKDGESLLPDEAFSGVDAELEAGRVVGEYRIEGKLGSGGFGTVYRAVHPLIGKAAAVKVLSRQYSSDPQMVTRFISEARAVNQIQNRHIIDIFSFGSLDDGRQYFVMELLDGTTLDRYLRERGRLRPEEALPILRGIARALDAAHAREIAHRDLKPENVFLANHDGELFPKLLDFGIAKLMGAAGTSGPKTNTGTPIGTPHYMSPEQCRGDEIDHRTDVYSFGIMAHELLSGKLPFEGKSLMEILMKQVQQAPPPLSSVCPDLSPALDGPILAMLSKEAGRRPRTVGEATDALARAAKEAGYNVTLAPTAADSDRSLPRPTPLVASSRTFAEAPTMGATPLTPSGLARQGEAALAASGPISKPQTFQGTSSDSIPPPAGKSRRNVVVLAALGACVIASGIAFSQMGKRERRAADATHRDHAPAAFPSAATPSTPTQSLPAAAAVPTSVEISVESNPSGATVSRGAESLGTTPTKIRLPRGGERVSLALRLDGYTPAKVDVDPKSDLTLSVPLQKQAVQRAGRPKKKGPELQGDLENPFGEK